MKKYFTLLSFLIITMVSFTGCEKSVKEEPNHLVGTKWFASYSDYLMVLEFTSDTEVSGYFAKPNGVYYSGQTTGTYKVSGNSVTFSGLTYRWLYAYYRLESGSVSGSLFSTTGQKTFDINKGDWLPWTDTFSKQ